MNLSSIPFSEDALEDILAFSQANPGQPAWPEDLARRFLTQLISDSSLVFDLCENGERIAVAVLLDRVTNPASLANLEVLGILPNRDPSVIVDQILTLAKERLPHSLTGFTSF
jgi:hypothetical protein